MVTIRSASVDEGPPTVFEEEEVGFQQIDAKLTWEQQEDELCSFASITRCLQHLCTGGQRRNAGLLATAACTRWSLWRLAVALKAIMHFRLSVCKGFNTVCLSRTFQTHTVRPPLHRRSSDVPFNGFASIGAHSGVTTERGQFLVSQPQHQ